MTLIIPLVEFAISIDSYPRRRQRTVAQVKYLVSESINRL
jgi:hypothetical protein